MFQRHAIEKFHDDEGLPMLVIDLVNGANVGMIERGGGFGLSLKTAENLRVLGYLVRQELEGHETAELHVLSFVDHPHTTAAELFDNAVMRDSLVDHGVGL